MNRVRRSPVFKHKPNTGRRSCHGFTLIELLLVLSLVGSLLGGTIGLLSLVQKSNQQGQRDLLHRQELRRFANDVRRDMHVAGNAEIKANTLVMTSRSPSSEITYRVIDGSLERRQTSDEDKSTQSHDRYRIDDDAKIAVEWVEKDAAVQWTITQSDRLENPVRIIASRRPSQ